MRWTRNDREVLYLAGILLLPLALTLFARYVWLTRSTFVDDGSFLTYSSFLTYILFPVPILVYYVPVLQHLPAFVYARYARDSSRDVLGKTESYFVAFLASMVISFAVTVRVTMLRGLPPALPFWQIDVLFAAGVLLAPASHAYFQYDEHEDFRRVVLLVMIYAPWAQILRLLATRTEVGW